jgi:uncharacterized protein involved in exopolysaccharide biosynthesis
MKQGILCLFLVGIFAAGSVPCSGQTTAKDKPATVDAAASAAVRSSPAYAEILLKRTELQAAYESLLLDYTEEYPKVQELRHTLGLMKRESGRLAAVKAADAPKLTLALGKLMVKKIELETELWLLEVNYKADHPDVKRAKRLVEIYEAAIKEILG